MTGAPRQIVEAIDVCYMGLKGAAYAFLIHGLDGNVLVETGPAATQKILMAGLVQHGVVAQDIRHVLLTHIHLDHAGAAGHFAKLGAEIHVHPFGDRHLVDPTKLISSSRRVHAELFERFYGEPLPIPQAQIDAMDDGSERILCGLKFRALHTPGHARHHIVWLLDHAGDRHAFMGDLGGILIPDSECIAIPMPPPEFDPHAWIHSLRRVIAESPTYVWLTHGACVATNQVSSRAFLQRAMDRVEQETTWLRELTASQHDEAHTLAAYQSLVLSVAASAGVRPQQQKAFLDEAFFRMNLSGARRAFGMSPPTNKL